MTCKYFLQVRVYRYSVILTSQSNGGSYGSSIPVKPVGQNPRIDAYLLTSALQTAHVKIVKYDTELSHRGRGQRRPDLIHKYLWFFQNVQACTGPLGPFAHKLEEVHPWISAEWWIYCLTQEALTWLVIHKWNLPSQLTYLNEISFRQEGTAGRSILPVWRN